MSETEKRAHAYAASVQAKQDAEAKLNSIKEQWEKISDEIILLEGEVQKTRKDLLDHALGIEEQ